MKWPSSWTSHKRYEDEEQPNDAGKGRSQAGQTHRYSLREAPNFASMPIRSSSDGSAGSPEPKRSTAAPSSRGMPFEVEAAPQETRHGNLVGRDQGRARPRPRQACLAGDAKSRETFLVRGPESQTAGRDQVDGRSSRRQAVRRRSARTGSGAACRSPQLCLQ